MIVKKICLQNEDTKMYEGAVCSDCGRPAEVVLLIGKHSPKASTPLCLECAWTLKDLMDETTFTTFVSAEMHGQDSDVIESDKAPQEISSADTQNSPAESSTPSDEYVKLLEDRIKGLEAEAEKLRGMLRDGDAEMDEAYIEGYRKGMTTADAMSEPAVKIALESGITFGDKIVPKDGSHGPSLVRGIGEFNSHVTIEGVELSTWTETRDFLEHVQKVE